MRKHLLFLFLHTSPSPSGIDFCGRNHSAVLADIAVRAVSAWIHSAFSLINCAEHQKIVQVLDQLLCERFRDVIKNVIYANTVIHYLNQIRHLHRLEGLPDLSFPEDALYLAPGQPVAGHPGG